MLFGEEPIKVYFQIFILNKSEFLIMVNIFRMFYSKTPKIKDARGNINPDSIASIEKVEIGGIVQWILIRGHDVNNPILLVLHGGPGTIEGPMAYKFERELEKYFIVINWDQRAAGKSYSKTIPKETMTPEQFVQDAHELIEYLRKRFKKEKIYIVGHSWGSILGTLLANRYPELFYAYVGVGQVVNQYDNERVSYDYTFEQAQKSGNQKAIEQLKAIQPYNGQNIEHLRIERKWLKEFGGFMYGEKSRWPLFKIAFGSPEYSFKDLFKFFKGSKFSLENMWPHLYEIDFFKQAIELKIPVYYCIGRHDYNTPFELAEKYFNELKAPKKKLIWFEKSAHSPNFEEPAKFHDVLINQVLSETYPGK